MLVLQRGQVSGEIEQPVLLGNFVGLVDSPWQNETEILGGHFVGLVNGNAGFKREQMFGLDPLRLGEDLPYVNLMWEKSACGTSV